MDSAPMLAGTGAKPIVGYYAAALVGAASSETATAGAATVWVAPDFSAGCL